MQRAVLGPTVLPDGFAVHYQPAAGTLEVGGDWYDVVDLPDGRYGVVVGDVVGRGLAAAAVMGQLRSAGRALLLESRSPGARAHRARPLRRPRPRRRGEHRVLRGDRPVPPAAMRYSSAGHPPAVVWPRRGRPRLLRGRPPPSRWPSSTGSSRPRPSSPCPPAAPCCCTPTGWWSGATRRWTRAWPRGARCSPGGRLPLPSWRRLLTRAAARRCAGRRRRVPALPPRGGTPRVVRVTPVMVVKKRG